MILTKEKPLKYSLRWHIVFQLALTIFNIFIFIWKPTYLGMSGAIISYLCFVWSIYWYRKYKNA